MTATAVHPPVEEWEITILEWKRDTWEQALLTRRYSLPDAFRAVEEIDRNVDWVLSSDCTEAVGAGPRYRFTIRKQIRENP